MSLASRRGRPSWPPFFSTQWSELPASGRVQRRSREPPSSSTMAGPDLSLLGSTFCPPRLVAVIRTRDHVQQRNDKISALQTVRAYVRPRSRIILTQRPTAERRNPNLNPDGGRWRKRLQTAVGPGATVVSGDPLAQSVAASTTASKAVRTPASLMPALPKPLLRPSSQDRQEEASQTWQACVLHVV